MNNIVAVANRDTIAALAHLDRVIAIPDGYFVATSPGNDVIVAILCRNLVIPITRVDGVAFIIDTNSVGCLCSGNHLTAHSHTY
ncbi:hypothetical protein QPJ95_17845 [Parasedimentitalea psychrophila]|uniref:Uncharacterized protein n=1 Tax=Parasedimentitalea psychrophila TaxID=2997337 RepID=A0A9Y2P3M1_9RHOB|nr:hypothetical protein [Parasedimentitalea psychrophila]WIY24419.1 hypothetical protein QPJ95_17845 [Parasedimentitalea psychrophila]